MDTDGLDIVLTWLTDDFQEVKKEVEGGISRARSTAAHIDALETRIQALKDRLGLPEELPTTPVRSSLRSVPHQSDTPSAIPSTVGWATIRQEAEKRLRARGINPESVSLDALLDPEEVARIERRFRGGFCLSTHLDRYDIAAAVTAGLIAALVDFLVVKIPRNIRYLGHLAQQGSPLTQWLHSLSIPNDNWLAQYFKTAFDRVKGIPISGFSGKTHRLQTLGHDPLVGLVIGTIDIMRGGLTAISKAGELFWLSGTGTAHYNPFTAFVWQIMHLFSDGFTKMGLPPPGWSLLQVLQVGNFGEQERTIADLARFMYLKGYDSRHFLTMSTSVAAAEVVLRGYFWIRRKLDEEYDTDNAHVAEVVGAETTSDHPRFQAMALVAHVIGVAANAGKVIVYAGNPLAINYPQWLRFLHAVFTWMRTKLRTPSTALAGHARANLKALEQGWPEVEVSDPSFPRLVVGGNQTV